MVSIGQWWPVLVSFVVSYAVNCVSFVWSAKWITKFRGRLNCSSRQHQQHHQWTELFNFDLPWPLTKGVIWSATTVAVFSSSRGVYPKVTLKIGLRMYAFLHPVIRSSPLYQQSVRMINTTRIIYSTYYAIRTAHTIMYGCSIRSKYCVMLNWQYTTCTMYTVQYTIHDKQYECIVVALTIIYCTL